MKAVEIQLSFFFLGGGCVWGIGGYSHVSYEFEVLGMQPQMPLSTNEEQKTVGSWRNAHFRNTWEVVRCLENKLGMYDKTLDFPDYLNTSKMCINNSWGLLGTGRMGGGGYRGGRRGRLYTYRYTVTTRMTSMRDISIFHNCEGQNHKTVSTDHNFWRERRAQTTQTMIFVTKGKKTDFCCCRRCFIFILFFIFLWCLLVCLVWS